MARWVHRAIFSHGRQGHVGEGVEDSQQVLLVGIRPRQKQEGNGQLLTPEDAGAEDDRHRSGNEDGKREEIHPVDPEHGRHAGRKQLVDGHGGENQRDPDGVVDLSVVDRRLRLEGPGTHGGQCEGDRRDQADVGKRRLLVGRLQQRAQRVAVGDQDGTEQHRHLDLGPSGLGRVGPARRHCVLPLLERGDKRVVGVGTYRLRSWPRASSAGSCSSSGRSWMRRSSEPPVHVVRRPRITGSVKTCASGRIRRCDPEPPRCRPGTVRSCPRPAGPAACCGSR